MSTSTDDDWDPPDILKGHRVWGESAYVRSLNRSLEAQAPAPKPKCLRERFLEWYQGQPEFVRNRAYSMSEFETALGSQGKYISAVLLDLGWRRKRIWSTAGRYHRYWTPPGLST